MKTCPGCGQTLELGAFNFKDRARGQTHTSCRTCTRKYFRDYYAANRERYIQRTRRRNEQERQANRKRLLDYLAEHPCVDCSETDPVVLQFDHSEPDAKMYEIGELLRRRFPWHKIQLEIAKCVVRCANCHQRRTAKQFGWYRLRSAEQAPVAQRIERRSSEPKVGGSIPSGRASVARLTACQLSLVLRLRRLATLAAVLLVIALATALWPWTATTAHAAINPTDAAPANAPAPTTEDETCLLGRAPPLLPQMLALVAILGHQATGEPLECVRPNFDNGDLLQQTSTGLLIYRTFTGMAIFTNGWTHWGLGPDGLVTWHGSGLDPPWVEVAWLGRAAGGGPAVVVAQTSPGAMCAIEYRTPVGSGSRALGLEPRQADAEGFVRWMWRIGPSTRSGTAQVTVTCDGASVSEPLTID